MKLKLPKSPVDQHQIEWWEVDSIGDNISIRPMAAVYHANTPWAAIKYHRTDGADFVDQWQVFSRGQFTGRMQGWESMVAMLDRLDALESVGEANERAIKIIDERILNHHIWTVKLGSIRRQIVASSRSI